MRILLDEQLPNRLARHISGHDVRTVRQQGWAGLSNGQLLLRAAAYGFDAFVTADRNLHSQQNIAASSLRVLVLIAPSIKLEDLLPLVPLLLEALRNALPGEVRQVGGP